jgi:GBP family porin
MKRNYIALAVLASCAGAASAQSNVTIYGTIDAGLVHDRGGAGGSVTKLSSGVASVSRLGFRGSEKLGDGLSAIFTLEAGTKVDTGESDVPGTLFNRQAYVGLSHDVYGAITVGRQYTPYYLTITGVADPFAAGLAGTAKNLLPTAGNNTRTSNTIFYTSPVWNGISGELAYSLGEQPGSNSAGRQLGAALAYARGPLNVRIGYINRNNDITAAAGAAMTPPVPEVSRGIGTNTLLAANYDFGVLKGYLAYGADKGFNSAPLPNPANPYGGVMPTPSTDSRDILVGLSMPLGTGTLMASHIRKNDRTSFNQDARQWGVGYLYPLSKRTNLYAAYARITNKNGAGYTVGNNAEPGTGNAAYNLGVRHTF